MSPALKQWIKNNNFLAILLAGGALWLGWHILVAIYYFLESTSQRLFLRLEGSYGQLGGAFGYALLGLGLGAAAGAITAQRRFRLDRRILLGAGALALLLAALAFLESSTGYVAAPDSQPAPESTTAATPSDTLTAIATPPLPAAPDTTGEPGAGLWLLTSADRSLLPDWHDSLGTTTAQAATYDTLQLLRRVRGWGRVVVWTYQGPTSTAGWVRLSHLFKLTEAVPASQPYVLPADKPMAKVEEAPTDTTQATSMPAAGTVAEHPVGHHAHTGQVGQLYATYALDWQPTGELSGSYYYDEKPGTIYRLTGAVDGAGELHLLEFTQGRQSARCVLQAQDGSYAGTMYNADGQQFSMTIH